jgi:hypothetical protein
VTELSFTLPAHYVWFALFWSPVALRAALRWVRDSLEVKLL